MVVYKHLFFDLDHTLWDFHTNSKEAISELYTRHELVNRGISSFEKFHSVYSQVNERYWSLYRVGKISKKVLRRARFLSALQRFGIEDEELGRQFGEDYIELSPYKTALLPGTHEILTYLQEKGYSMHIITNGFEEVQHVKLRESKLTPYFKEIITSEAVQARKPNPLIFEHAFSKAGATASDSIMIGDSMEADIKGARSMNIAQVYFNPEGIAHSEEIDHEIKSLLELKEIL